MHLFLSPHLDDAVLSCGGTIHRLTQQEESVVILTIMAGDPPSPLPQSPIIQDLHQRWDVGYNPITNRRTEDERAAKRLGARPVHMLIPDCVYRTSDALVLYPSEESLWAKPHPMDNALAILVETPLPFAAEITSLYMPMGVGHHVDHQIVRDWALTLGKANPQLSVKLYEEYPYTRDKIAVTQARRLIAAEMNPKIVALDEVNVAAKTEAISCYKSQITTFWNSITAMEQEVRQLLTQTGENTPAERYWQLI